MIDKEKLIKWLQDRHTEHNSKYDRAGNYLIQGVCLGNVSMSHELSVLIESGEFDIKR
ncbi:hypothetical protein Q7A53_05615 [Halobacillus rhizosphaerae]|uniref:hypothetical protein n=1 Tax=Halobacillus rhizosphaerae TaxID=3064889 RepID=UPI00398B5A8D